MTSGTAPARAAADSAGLLTAALTPGEALHGLARTAASALRDRSRR
ncbi:MULTISPECIES: hypothetical protein [Streptomyces]|nr:hypothetical protein [Streptomyces ruber]